MPAVIKKSWEFDLIFRTGIRANGDLVRLLFLRRDELKNEIKVGYTVGKNQGKAHVRNRGKRILRAAFHELTKNYNILPGTYFILGLKNKALDSKSTEIFKDLLKILRMKKLLSE